MQDVSEVTGPNADRTGFIGGSDAPIIMQVSKWKTVQQLYYEKRGELEPEDLSDNEAVQVGSIFEDSIAQLYEWKTGKKLRRVNQHQVHPEYPWMRAQIDRKVEGERWHTEIKSTNLFAFLDADWGDEGTDEIPFMHLVQGQHQCAVTGYEGFDVPVLVNNRLNIYSVERDDELIQMIIEAEAAFWDHVQNGVVPAMDYSHPKAIDWMKRKFPGTNGQVVDLPDDALDLAERYNELGQIAREARKARDEVKAQLQDMIGEAAVGVLPNDAGGFTRREVGEKEISYTRSPYIDFRFTKNPKVD